MKRGRVIEIYHDVSELDIQRQPIVAPRVIVVAATENRSLRSILENVINGWLQLLELR